MKPVLTRRKRIALALLLLMSANIILPPACAALTSGPTQPEARSFQPAGVSDMVDLFSGDFKYNIPLLDVDGYPINLNYESGSGMDDEASWTGLGWNVNVGAINRQMRGVPDDMSGDNVETDHYTKPKVTVGGRLSAKIESGGKAVAKKGGVSVGGTFSVGVFNDNYTGIGADVSANAGISFSAVNENKYTAGLGLGITSNTNSGVTVTPSLNLGIEEGTNKKITEKAGLSASLGYNSRSGLKAITLGSSFDVTKNFNYKISVIAGPYFAMINQSEQHAGTGGGASGSLISFNTEPILPDIQIPYRSRYGSFSIDAGGALEHVFIGGGGTGYKTVREVAQNQLINPAYGFLYAERGKNQKNAVMDFTRENDNPVIPESTNLAVPIPTPDLFTFTSQTGIGQFRLYRGGSGAFFDNEVSDDDGTTSVGGDLGLGAIFHAGVTLYQQSTKNTNRKWVSNNNYLGNGDFQDASYTDPNAQHAYFKMVGEKTAEDAAMVSKLHSNDALEVSISGKTANPGFTTGSLSSLQKQNRAIKHTEISYLTAEEASKAGLDKTIQSYPLYEDGDFHLPASHKPVPQNSYPRFDDVYRKKHHFSEITVTDGGGKRMVYGLPVYNVKHTEYSFAAGSAGTDYSILSGTNNIIPLPLNPDGSINHTKGIDNYYHAQSQPAYAASFLLTSILSPDYVDRTGDGISDDDIGTAIKFNYSKMPSLFKWRTPFSGATLNRAMLADKDDDKASIVYGEKELWYTSSIESKTKIAYFITQDRRDAMGVTDFTGNGINTGSPQRCLKEIRLYSKADLSKPIKTVKFEYTYELCRGVPNNADNAGGLNSDPLKGGKLTLKKVYFEYANSPKGANYPYLFTYNNDIDGRAVNYIDMASDRWGIYKTSAENLFPLKNDEFPYTNQDLQGNDPSVKTRLDKNVALWHLSTINLPTGGIINVTYEADDYAYVQDKKAMVMGHIESLISGNGADVAASALRDAKGFRIKIPDVSVSGDPTAWFKRKYLNDADYIYTKFLVKISTPNSASGGTAYDNDFVPCYAKIKSVSVDGSFAKILLEDRSDGGVSANPIIFSAWQRMKNDYPRYAYPGYDRRTKDQTASSGVADAVKAIFSALGNLSELMENFYQKASRKNYCGLAQIDQSFVKICKADGHKFGGGSRVKQIQINDSWQVMTGNTNLVNMQYGQAYDYTTIEDGKRISSGVATYEPSVGNDENALKEPITYVEKIKGAIDNFYDVEGPFGESLFPAPSVGYSQVTVTDLNKDHIADPTLRTGYSVHEFYTAKDFPVKTITVPLEQNDNKPANKFSFLGATSIDERTMTQGYSVELNDMHGKVKAEHTYNQSGAEIASTHYFYHADEIGADKYKLNNAVSVVNPDGTIANNTVIGRDIDFFTDFREFETKNSGMSNDLGFDMIGLSFVSFPLPHFPTYDNSEYKLFRSACAIKITQNYGLLDHVVKMENGSSITTTNIAYDGTTGEPIVTSTQNEFDKSIYSVNLPAYWVYPGMGGAYQNAGTLLKDFSTNTAGRFVSYNSFLKAGDELADLTSGLKYFVIENQSPSESSPSKKLVNNGGKLATSFTAAGLVKLLRSGYRNILDADVQSLVCLNNPIQGNRLQITNNTDLTNLRVINASAKTFNESWPMQKPNVSDSTLVVNTDHDFTYTSAINSADHGFSGAYIYDGLGSGAAVTTNTFLNGGLNRSGVWPNPNTNLYLDAPIGLKKDFTIVTAGTYYVGYSGDDAYVYTIDNFTLPNSRDNTIWSVYPVMLTAGVHHLSFQATNITLPDQPNTPANNPGAIGMEIYNCSEADLHTGSALTTVFSTTGVIGDTNLDSFLTIGGNRVDHFSYNRTVNPYTAGFLGNWRERESMVFQQSRHQKTGTSTGFDTWESGYINNFASFWYYNSPGGWTTDQAGNRARWVTANTVTSYDKYGQQLENKDALGRFSAAKFDFNGELPAGVASNAKNREIYLASFEDKLFSPGTVSGDAVNDFKQPSTGAAIAQFIDNTTAHSGNYSVKLPADGLVLSTDIQTGALGTTNLLKIFDTGEYSASDASGVYPNGFEPSPGKYIFDVWVYDWLPNDKSVNLNLSANSSTVTLTCKAVVEGWKLLEGTVNITATSGAFNLALTSAVSTLNIDDLRIHPADSQLKSYVYDDQTMRLMAEIDENGFATFYEYDDEGLLIRVKKETERGVMTIKESRSSYRKGTL
ncbi:MAG: hypothetical protein V4577_24380 [Bacteroidota bacterium]